MDSNTIRYPVSQLDLTRMICYWRFGGGRANVNFDIYQLRNTFWIRVTKFLPDNYFLILQLQEKFLAIQDRGIALFSHCASQRRKGVILRETTRDVAVTIVIGDKINCNIVASSISWPLGRAKDDNKEVLKKSIRPAELHATTLGEYRLWWRLSF